MADTIAPALTPEEWCEGHADWGCDQHGQRRGCAFRLGSAIQPALPCVGLGIEELAADGTSLEDTFGIVDVPPNGWHKVAALALHGQPFGFTWEMVDGIRECITGVYSEFEGRKGLGGWQPAVDAATAAADRIAALLPPRET